jgi:protein tyrosine/serine phosphatase
MSEPVISLETVHNFRDFGGYAAGPDRRVARRRLYRSAHLAHASDRDLETLRSLGVAVIADLRRTGERLAEPNRTHAGCTWRVIASDKGPPEDLAPHLQFLRDLHAITHDALKGYMCAVYEGIPYDERHVELFREVFGALVEAPGALLVHCAAGKDRTGVLCALILDALGVSHDDVMADYELTNRTANVEGIMAQSAARISRRIGRPVTAEELRPMAGVSREYLEVAWRAIAARSGSLAGYRRDVLGLDARREADLRAALLEPT